MKRAEIQRLFHEEQAPTLPDGCGEVDFRALLEGSLDVIWYMSLLPGGGRKIYVSPSGEEVFGWSRAELLQMRMEDLFTAESIETIYADMKRFLQGQANSTVVVEAVKKNREPIWLEVKVRSIGRAPDGGVDVAIYMRDVTDRKRLQDKLTHQALVDGLTELSNRRAFDEAICREWARTLAESSMLSLSCWMWTISRASTTHTATKLATIACGPWREPCSGLPRTLAGR